MILNGHVALVTGGGRGIGAVLASALAEAGAAVGIMARTRSQLDQVVARLRAAGGQAVAFTGDARQPGTVEDAVRALEEAFGPLTLAVHCAGTLRVVGPFWEADLEQWWREVEIYAKGAAVLANAVLPGMLARGQGRIICVYGNLGDDGTAYCSATRAARPCSCASPRTSTPRPSRTAFVCSRSTPGLSGPP